MKGDHQTSSTKDEMMILTKCIKSNEVVKHTAMNPLFTFKDNRETGSFSFYSKVFRCYNC